MKELKSIDEKHFWFGDYLVDLVNIEHFRSGFETKASVGRRANPLWGKIHDVNRAKIMLKIYAERLNKGFELKEISYKDIPRCLTDLRNAGMKIPEGVCNGKS